MVEEMELRREVSEIQDRADLHQARAWSEHATLRELEGHWDAANKKTAKLRADLSAASEHPDMHFEMPDGKVLEAKRAKDCPADMDKAERDEHKSTRARIVNHIAHAVVGAAKRQELRVREAQSQEVGRYRGLPVTVANRGSSLYSQASGSDAEERQRNLFRRFRDDVVVTVGDSFKTGFELSDFSGRSTERQFSPSGLMARIEHHLGELDAKIEEVNTIGRQRDERIASAKARIAEPFPEEERLAEVTARHAEVAIQIGRDEGTRAERRRRLDEQDTDARLQNRQRRRGAEAANA